MPQNKSRIVLQEMLIEEEGSVQLASLLEELVSQYMYILFSFEK
jgi:hypothetical protein